MREGSEKGDSKTQKGAWGLGGRVGRGPPRSGGVYTAGGFGKRPGYKCVKALGAILPYTNGFLLRESSKLLFLKPAGSLT